jgi:replication-associated recombination protein RarA
MSEFMAFDQWANMKTRNGLSGDLVVSALQKSIRRGDEEVALNIAYEMYITSREFEEKLWRRLSVICVEDIGFGDTNACVFINTLNNLRENFPYNDGDRPIFFVHAIRYLCRQKKERSSDIMKNLMVKKFESGFIPEIPEYAYDMHTQKGREMGRDEIHFLREASKVFPQLNDDDEALKEELIAVIEKEAKEKIKKTGSAFIYSQNQA